MKVSEYNLKLQVQWMWGPGWG